HCSYNHFAQTLGFNRSAFRMVADNRRYFVHPHFRGFLKKPLHPVDVFSGCDCYMEVIWALAVRHAHPRNLQHCAFRVGICNYCRVVPAVAINQLYLLACREAQYANSVFAFLLVQDKSCMFRLYVWRIKEMQIIERYSSSSSLATAINSSFTNSIFCCVFFMMMKLYP